MRSLLVVLLALAAAGGAAWLLLRESDPSDVTEASPPTVVRDGVRKPVEDEPLAAVVPRQGVMSPRDRDLVADPDAPDWHGVMLRFSAPAGERLTGRVLLEAIEKHLYVRAKDFDTLDALRRQDLEIAVPPEMPMSAVVLLLERAGYHVQVQPPRFVFRRMPPKPAQEPR